eukprot:scaffold13.g231.t1
MEVAVKVLESHAEHKDMEYVAQLKRDYPNLWVKATQFGVANPTSMFVAFEGKADDRLPLFKGVAAGARRLGPARQAALLRPRRARAAGGGGRALPARLRVRAMRDNVADKEKLDKLGDWRTKQMIELAHAYFVDFLTKGKIELADSMLDENVVHVDRVWDPVHPTAGVEGMKHYIHDLRVAFPDFWVTIDQIAVCDPTSIMVTYEGACTGLGEYHNKRGTHHTSSFNGANLMRFNHDRSRITEIHVWRSAFAEDLQEVKEFELQRLSEGGFRELRLKRLV